MSQKFMLKLTSHAGVCPFPLSYQLAWLSVHSHSRLKQVLDKWRNITWNFLFTGLNVLLFQLQKNYSKILLELYITFVQIAVTNWHCQCLLLVSHLFMIHNASTVAVIWWKYLCMRIYTRSCCFCGDRNVVSVMTTSLLTWTVADMSLHVPLLLGQGSCHFRNGLVCCCSSSNWGAVYYLVHKFPVATVWNSHVHKPTKEREHITWDSEIIHDDLV